MVDTLTENMKRYLKMNGRYRYENYQIGIVAIMDEVSICFDRESHLLLDHGDPEDVMEYYEEILKVYQETEWVRGSIIMISAKFSVEELNKLLLDPHYITGFIENSKDLFARDIREDE